MLRFDLSLVQLEDLLEEVKRRHDAMLIATLRHETDDREVTEIDWRGGKITCLGLAYQAAHLIEWDAARSQEED